MCSEVQSMRVCKTCGVEKPLDKKHFYWRSDAKAFRKGCKTCWQEKQLIATIGVDFKVYHHMLKAQGHRCKICQTTLESSRYSKFAVDHCHKTGRVRGLLCTNCNTAIGLMKDSVERLASAIKYLTHNSHEDIVYSA